MAKAVKHPKRFTRDALARFLSSAMEEAIVHHDPTVKRPEVLAAGYLAGRIAADFLFLPLKKQRTLAEDMSGLAAAIEQALANAVGGSGVESQSSSEPREPSGWGDPALGPIEEWAGPVAGPTFLETNYDIARSTLHRWHVQQKVIGFRTGGRKHVYPLAQFIDRRPASGLSEVLKYMPHPRAAWVWLTQPNPATENLAPVELLKLDRVDEVVTSAKKFAASLKSSLKA